jgi:hypothetical protein
MHLSHQKAARYYLNQDKEEIRLYAHRLLDQLVSLPLEAKLIFIDEFSISTRPSTHYQWGLIGKQPQLASDEKQPQRTNGFISVEVMAGEIDLWQNPQAKAEQVAHFCFRQARKAQQQGFARLIIVLDNNKTHLKKMKTQFEDLLQEANVGIQVHFIHTARYAPTYNLAEYIIAVIRKKALHHLPADFTLEQVCQRMYQILQQEPIQTKQQIWNTLDHILNAAILGNYSFKHL